MEVDLTLEQVADIVAGIKVYESGQAMVLTQIGGIVAHKDTKLAGTSVFDTEQLTDKTGLRRAFTEGKPFRDIYGPKDNKMTAYYYPIHFDLTGQTWYFVISAPLNEVLAGVSALSYLTMGLSLGVFILSILLILFVVRATVKPLGVLAGAARTIAAGNLKTVIDDKHFGGEVKTLSVAFKDMIASLLRNIDEAEALSADARAQTVKAEAAMREAEAAHAEAENARSEGLHAAAERLEDVVSVLSAASEQLSTQIGQSENGSSMQAERIAEAASAMEEMSATIIEVAQNAGSAADASERTRAVAQEGAGIVRQSADGIRNVQTVSLALKEDMATLTGQVEGIKDIMNVINDVADQTNLLALNAAIEAARAGDAGRGFAVVADEVRKLAEKTMVSTATVGSAVNNIRSSVERGMQQADNVAALIECAASGATASGDALTGIVSMVDETADRMRSIATASEEQSAASQEISHSVALVNDIAEQGVLTMREAAGAVRDMARQARLLNELIREMKAA